MAIIIYLLLFLLTSILVSEMHVHVYCSEHPLDIDIVVPDSKVVRSGGRKRLFTSPVEELALEHGAALQCWTEFKSYALRNKKWCAFDEL